MKNFLKYTAFLAITLAGLSSLSCTREKMSIEDEQTMVGDTLDLQQGVGEGTKPNEPNSLPGGQFSDDQ